MKIKNNEYRNTKTIIKIQNKQLTKLSDKIGQFNNLQSLYLENNILSELPSEIGQLKNLQILCVDYNNLIKLPSEIEQLQNLTLLSISHNKLTYLPNEIKQLKKLKYLNVSFNKLINLPSEIGQLQDLIELIIGNNNLSILPSEIGQLINLTYLSMCNNKLTNLPNEIERLQNLETLYINNNKLINLPYQLINLTNCMIIYYDNLIDYLSPALQRSLNRQKCINTHIYNDNQNVHDSNIQKSIKESIIKILNHKPSFIIEEVKTQILEDKILDKLIKEQIIEYCNDNSIHSYSNCTFEEVLLGVWNKIKLKSENEQIEIIKILNNEMKDSMCKCFTGRLSRLINCLNGFDDDVKIQINDNQQIGNIILLIKEQLLLKNQKIDLNEWRELSRKALEEREYKKEIIDEWLESINK